METKANYVLVGVFTLIVSLLAFAFVFWIARFGKHAILWSSMFVSQVLLPAFDRKSGSVQRYQGW